MLDNILNYSNLIISLTSVIGFFIALKITIEKNRQTIEKLEDDIKDISRRLGIKEQKIHSLEGEKIKFSEALDSTITASQLSD